MARHAAACPRAQAEAADARANYSVGRDHGMKTQHTITKLFKVSPVGWMRGRESFREE